MFDNILPEIHGFFMSLFDNVLDLIGQHMQFVCIVNSMSLEFHSGSTIVGPCNMDSGQDKVEIAED